MVGILLGVNRAVRLVFNGVAGWCYDRMSQRGLFLGGLTLGAVSTACCAAAYQFWLLFVGRALWGVAWSLIWIGGGVILLNLADASERGRWTGWYQTWFFLGIGTGAFVGGMLTDLVGYHPTLWIISVTQACEHRCSRIVLARHSAAKTCERGAFLFKNADDVFHIQFWGSRFCFRGSIASVFPECWRQP